MSDDAPHLLALTSLPKLGPRRLRSLLRVWDPATAWDRVAAGQAVGHPTVAASLGAQGAGLGDTWRVAARDIDPAELAARSRTAGVEVVAASDAAYPDAFRSDPDPPPVVSMVGDPTLLDRPAVAVVGTRSCTRYGHDVARTLGRDLAEAGVAVVSGLALGVDAAAHQGVLDAASGAAGPVAVVGSGLDVVYPRGNRALWERVGERGLLLSEAPLGARPEAWRFPARNRLIAALVRLVVVVESGERGGSMHTVDEAAARSVEVGAVPGPVTSPASRGTNRLLADGATPVLGARDVLELLGLDTPPESAQHTGPTHDAAPLGDDARRVVDALTAGPATIAELAEAVEIPFARLAEVTAGLEASGRIVRNGGWYERCTTA